MANKTFYEAHYHSLGVLYLPDAEEKWYFISEERAKEALFEKAMKSLNRTETYLGGDTDEFKLVSLRWCCKQYLSADYIRNGTLERDVIVGVIFENKFEDGEE